MTDDHHVLRLAPDCLPTLAAFLRSHPGEEVTIFLEPERTLGGLEVQLLLAAASDPAGPSVRVAPASDQVRSGLRRLGVDGLVALVA